MDLHVESDGSDEEWYIASETKRHVEITICRLHIEPDPRVVSQAKVMTGIF